jgi:AMMECR1 domain-containing protein
MLTDAGRRGLLLPQVPVEHGWDRETFLEQLCRKARVPSNAWREGAKIQRFSALVFAEKSAG